MKIVGSIPEEVLKIVHEREEAREKQDFVKADRLRNEIGKLGYEIIDGEDSIEVRKIESNLFPQNSFLVLFGSGEISSVGRSIQDHIFQKLKKDNIKIVIVSTPAGFQPNVETVHEEIADFFNTSLANYHPNVEIVYANIKSDANNRTLIAPIESADYIFMGPGSPTYAVKNLESTLLLKKIIERINSGASLALSSAAVIAVSHFCLPVYEIYKVGEDLHWERGLNLFKDLLRKEVSFIPHFNNNEGGDKNDTSRCFMGEKRFGKLLELLPESENVTGIDEQTSIVINLKTKEEKVMGKGDMSEVIRR